MEAYRFQDRMSDKFWRIEYAGAALAVNYGKIGTIGRYQVKEFGSKELCEKEVKKLTLAKLKKGYQPFAEFDPNGHFYLDDKETGLHPLTSHPRFRACFTEEFYYDCVDEETPFGSDEGSDTLGQIAEGVRKDKSLNFASFPSKIVETYWGMTYLPAFDISWEAVKKLTETDKTNLTQSNMVTYATAFAQIKITGRLDAALKVLALNAMRRTEITAEILGWSARPSEVMEKMIADLEAFPADEPGQTHRK
ncbi:MAG: WGR domain-containing protein [Synergistaceae bacterium]|jgi:uncharacterized protein YfeS|nr:WGR domain-containing protein [Synergistaceae bacterium]